MKLQTYLDCFDSWQQVAEQFCVLLGPEPERVFAIYQQESYEGSAAVIFLRDGKWYAAGGGHCSCYGLEDQWEPEEFDPVLYLEGRKAGKTTYYMYGDANEKLDAWLAWAITF